MPQIIAIALPAPLIICDGCVDEDDGECLSFPMMVLAFSLPAVANIVIGNVLEPVVFGKTLNLTVASVLFSLFFWTLMWGITGAILSVPILSLTKILLLEADHPWARRMVDWIREDPGVDEAREIAKLQAYQDLRVSLALVCLRALNGLHPLCVPEYTIC